MNVENVRVILERTFEMPVAESDAQIVLDRLVELQAKEAAEQNFAADMADAICPHCGRLNKVHCGCNELA